MTNLEFQNKLMSAQTFDDLVQLRREVSAPIYINSIKRKIIDLANENGYTAKCVLVCTLKSYTPNTDCGQFSKNVKINGSSRIFPKNSVIDIYVNDKFEKGKTAYVYYKQSNN